MKFLQSLFILAALLPSSLAFSVVRPDASALVEQALKTTAAYGISSPEAKVAWDIVEELDASDNSEATKGSLDQECEIAATSPECLEYGRFLEELTVVRDAMARAAKTKQRVSLVEALQAIRIQGAEGTKVKSSPELTEALTAAKQATAKHGVTSPEARLAWETYEEIASAGYDNAVNVVSLLEECAIDVGADACRAMEELERVMPVLLSLDLAQD